MRHLIESNMGYFTHLYRAWRWAFILIVHGIFPETWKTKVSEEICNKSDKTRRYLIEKHYGLNHE